ncbi:su-w[a]- [Drosophila busckii]|uniref:Su-w[a] n=1 Tax=Drosophila busckii TaxID=30019 RepID=A0A0M4EQF7_DROBS|nr:protein suppressor of white apricot isoform X2 [Drosophila busckii]ALC48165.1 su-w[a]- [Drosophila busckii]
MPYNIRAGGSNAMVREYAGGSISGILRKPGGSGGAAMAASAAGVGGAVYNAAGMVTDGRHPALELLVFGYACKVFRDDEKARDMDQGKQLIPWMGDVNLKIDRYDVRGALCELGSYEAPPGGYGNRLEYLSSDEQRAEQLCEEERYLFLYRNEEELRLQQEEDLKRLHQEISGGSYSQVELQYDAQGQLISAGTESTPTTSTAVSSVATAEESELPYKMPQNLLIAPAADIKLPETMKQHAIIEKTARFIATQGAQMEILIKAKQAANAQFDFLSQGGELQPYYRHILSAIKQNKYAASIPPSQPSPENAAATPKSPKQQIITVPTIKYKPSANCAYTQLISKIKGVPLQSVLDDDAHSQHSAGSAASPTPSCKSEGQSQSSGDFKPVLLQYTGSIFTHESEAAQDNANDGPPQVKLLKNTSALALAQDYSSGSDEEDENEHEEQAKPQQPQPPPQKSSTNISSQPVADVPPPALLNFPLPEDSLRHIIDKTATYVIKNGRQFEETLRTKSVERFNFLLPEHKFYAYYMYKITGDVDAASKEEKTRKAAAVAAALISKKGLGVASTKDKTAVPVCFSIRPRDESTTLTPALPQDVSDEEEQQQPKPKPTCKTEIQKAGMPDSVQRAIKQVETQLLARTGNQKAATARSQKSPTGSQKSATVTTLTSPLKEQRQAEDKVKDKLAQIARDKLNGMISREKQLQLERKRKALAFLNQIKEGPSALAADTATEATAASKAPDAEAASDCESNDSVRSIPITYFGPDDDDEDEAEAQTKPQQQSKRKEDDEDEAGDLEKYNLLNDDSTNTYKSKQITAQMLLSEEDNVQTASAAAAKKLSSNRSRSHRSSRSRSKALNASVSRSSSESGRRSRSRDRQRLQQKRKASVMSQPRRRSRSPSPSRHHHQRQRHARDAEESSLRRKYQERHMEKRDHNRHKRRRRSSEASGSQ